MQKRGLSQRTAEINLKKYGRNELKELSQVSAFRILTGQIRKNVVIYMLIAAMIFSFIVGKNITAYTIIFVVVVVISVGFLQEYKAEKAIKALRGMITSMTRVRRDGKEIEVQSALLVPGDIIILRSGEKIPADAILLESTDLRVNESVLTGESAAIEKKPAQGKSTAANIIYMGTFVLNGHCTAQITHTGMNTEFGKIAGMIAGTSKELPLQIKVNKIAQYMVYGALVVAILTGVVMTLQSPVLDWPRIVEILLVVIALAIAAFPEGFPVVLITALATGTRRMAEKNAIVNRMSIIETLGETTVICSDKTGTITKGEMTITKLFDGTSTYEISGVGYESEGNYTLDGKKIDAKSKLSLMMKNFVLCNDARISKDDVGKEYKISGSPTEGALLIAAAKSGIFVDEQQETRVEEIPFNSERKMMAVLCKSEKGFTVYAKGAPEIILSRCTSIMKSGKIVRLQEPMKRKIHATIQAWTTKSYRTLAFAYAQQRTKRQCSDLDSNLIFLGLVAMIDPPRDEVKESIEHCFAAGIKVKMITGDNKDTAIAIARQIGLTGTCLLGQEIDNLTDQELSVRVKGVSVFARVRPEHKLRIVHALKASGELVAMTGDGVNDAPALKEAHIGVAMGKNGTDVTREVADLILKDDHFSTIVDAIREGRTIFSNIQKFASYQLSINCAQLSLVFFSILFGLPLPLLAIQILFMNLVSDEILAIMLAFNPYSKDAMSVKPRKNSAIITREIMEPLAIAAAVMSIGSLAAFYVSLNVAGASLETSRTVAFVTMNMLAVANAFQFRSFRKLTMTRTPFTNKYLLYGTALAIAFTLTAVYSPFHTILGLEKITLQSWIIALVAGFSLVVVLDVYKYYRSSVHC